MRGSLPFACICILFDLETLSQTFGCFAYLKRISDPHLMGCSFSTTTVHSRPCSHLTILLYFLSPLKIEFGCLTSLTQGKREILGPHNVPASGMSSSCGLLLPSSLISHNRFYATTCLIQPIDLAAEHDIWDSISRSTDYWLPSRRFLDPHTPGCTPCLQYQRALCVVKIALSFLFPNHNLFKILGQWTRSCRMICAFTSLTAVLR